MEKILFSLIPIAAFWTSYNTLLNAAKLVNELRDKVITGRADQKDLSTDHLKVMFLDYRLVTVSSVLAAWLFAGAIAWAGCYLWSSSTLTGAKGISYILWLIAFVEVIFGFFFIWCSVHDHRAMYNVHECLKKNEHIIVVFAFGRQQTFSPCPLLFSSPNS
ncbi:hypothetical protein JYT29_03245 [Nitrospina gracilis]|nr:hypothetical protein [Nitrospina gracilis]